MRDLKVRKILHRAVLIYDFHIFITTSSSFHGFITNQFNDLERCTGIAEIRGSNPVQAWIFSGFLFATSKVASITAMIFFPSILHTAVLIYDFHIFITQSPCMFDKTVLKTSPASFILFFARGSRNGCKQVKNHGLITLQQTLRLSPDELWKKAVRPSPNFCVKPGMCFLILSRSVGEKKNF